MTGPRLLVVGGGIVGRSVAYYAAGAGAEVHLIDADADPSSTTRASLGVLTHFNGGDDTYGLLYRDGHALHELLAEQLKEETGMDVGWRPLGGIDVAFTEADLQALVEMCQFNKARGCVAELLDGEGVRTMEPLLREEAIGGLYFPGDHRVDPPALAAALLEAGSRQGVDVTFGTALSRLEARGGGVQAEFAGDASGSLPTEFDYAVVAAGAWTGQLLAASSAREGVAEEVAVRPVRGQHCVYGAGGGNLRRVLRYNGHHLIPSAEGITVAATVEEVGFDLGTTEAAATQFGEILERVLGIGDRPIHQRAGLRPKPRKGRPVIAPLDDMPGVFVASGHYKNGVLLGPITGQTVAAWVLEGQPPRDMSHFAIAR
jgi:glycine oxidase